MVSKKYYFTFGSHEQFPYQNTYLTVEAPSRALAIKEYRKHYPDVNRDIVNCAFIYNEQEWQERTYQYYPHPPAEELTADVKPRLFVDSDGTLAEWRNISLRLTDEDDAEAAAKKLFDILQTPGYFYSLQPNQNVVDAVRELALNDKYEVFILTCYPTDGERSSPRKEKDLWFDKYLPEVDEKHRIYVPYGECKTHYIPNGLSCNDVLLDDKTSNLRDFVIGGGRGLKLLNNINSSNGSWQGSRLSYLRGGHSMAEAISVVLESYDLIRDAKPPRNTTHFDYEHFDFGRYFEEIAGSLTTEQGEEEELELQI